jgi:hypothetical protein
MPKIVSRPHVDFITSTHFTQATTNIQLIQQAAPTTGDRAKRHESSQVWTRPIVACQDSKNSSQCLALRRGSILHLGRSSGSILACWSLALVNCRSQAAASQLEHGQLGSLMVSVAEEASIIVLHFRQRRASGEQTLQFRMAVL